MCSYNMSIKNRSLICIYPDDELDSDEYILKQGIRKTVAELLRLTFREDDKHMSMAGHDPRESRVTNWNFAGLWRAYDSTDRYPDDELARVYPGIFDFTEYFSRSVDASKGDFFEMRIAAADPSFVLDVDRDLQNLPQYIYAPSFAWRDLHFTDGNPLTEQEREKYEMLDRLSIDFAQAPESANVDHEANTRQADSVLLHEHNVSDIESKRTLVFGEQRSSVNTGGTTARGSLYDKPKALLKGLGSDSEVVDASARHDLENVSLPSDSLTMFDLFQANSIDQVNFFIGMLFNTIRQPAVQDDDRKNGRWSESVNQTNNIESLCGRLDNVTVDSFDTDRLDLKITIQDPTGQTDRSLSFRIAHEYGNHYVNALYNGYPEHEFDQHSFLPAVGEYDLATVMGETSADDLWLNFSIAERENKAFYYGMEDEQEGKNNAMRMVEMILDSKELRDKLASFRTSVENGDRDGIRTAFIQTCTEFGEAYHDSFESHISPIYAGEELSYAYDLAIHILSYDVIVSPIYLKLLPDYKQYVALKEDLPRMASVRKSMEQFVYEQKEEYNGADRVAIFKAIRAGTEYVNGGLRPDSPTDTIDWSSGLTSSEVANKINAESTSPHYLEGNNHNLIKSKEIRREKKYAVPADISMELDEFILRDDASGSAQCRLDDL